MKISFTDFKAAVIFIILLFLLFCYHFEFIDQFDLELDPNTCMQNVEIVMFRRDELTDSQLDKTLSSFAVYAGEDPNFSIKLLLQNWNDFGDHAISSIKILANTDVFGENNFEEKTTPARLWYE